MPGGGPYVLYNPARFWPSQPLPVYPVTLQVYQLAREILLSQTGAEIQVVQLAREVLLNQTGAEVQVFQFYREILRSEVPKSKPGKKPPAHHPQHFNPNNTVARSAAWELEGWWRWERSLKRGGVFVYPILHASVTSLLGLFTGSSTAQNRVSGSSTKTLGSVTESSSGQVLIDAVNTTTASTSGSGSSTHPNTGTGSATVSVSEVAAASRSGYASVVTTLGPLSVVATAKDGIDAVALAAVAVSFTSIGGSSVAGTGIVNLSMSPSSNAQVTSVASGLVTALVIGDAASALSANASALGTLSASVGVIAHNLIQCRSNVLISGMSVASGATVLIKAQETVTLDRLQPVAFGFRYTLHRRMVIFARYLKR